MLAQSTKAYPPLSKNLLRFLLRGGGGRGLYTGYLMLRYPSLVGEEKKQTIGRICLQGGIFQSGGEYSWEFLVGVCHQVLQILTLFNTKKMPFSTPVFTPDL